MNFELKSKYSPCGDQQTAIDSISDGLNDGFETQVLLGVTGSGKTFTMAKIIEKVQRPALIIAHNKTLAAQLCNEFREFFPKNRVEFFVSYYDYYQPEAYIPRSDTYIEKELQLNEEIDKLRHSATASLSERDDVIVVASVSCIYGLGGPVEYFNQAVSLREGDSIDRDELARRLVDIQYKRADFDFGRSTFRMRGDIVDIFPSYNSEIALRVELFGDTIERISEIDPVTSKVLSEITHAMVFPASHYIVSGDKDEIFAEILKDKAERVAYFEQNNKLIEAQRINERVNYDVEMIKELGYCNGIENYSRYFDGRKQGEPPYTLLDFLADDFVLFVDESHITLPQIRGMYNGDKARKTNLVDYGFRLPAAADNRPLMFDEFMSHIKQMVAVSATPADYELQRADNIAHQILRPTGLLDPEIEVLSTKNQIDVLIEQINETTKRGNRTLVTTLTKKMAESLTNYLKEVGIKVKYMHSDIDTLERIEIVGGLRRGEFDVLVGINLLREGLDLPEVELVAILDADKEGFLRSESTLIQTIGRAARNDKGRVLMFADNMTDSMARAIGETKRRRELQDNYNKEHNIVPKTIQSEIKNSLEITKKKKGREKSTAHEMIGEIERLKGMMHLASEALDFERAIKIRDEIAEIKREMKKLS